MVLLKLKDIKHYFYFLLMSELYVDRKIDNKIMDIKKLKLSYSEFKNAIRQVSDKIKQDKYVPDVILSIARGGLIVGTQLSYNLGIKTIGSINMEFYSGINKRLEKPIIVPPKIDLEQFRDKNVLIADDVLDTGSTMIELINLILPIVKSYKTMVIFKKNQSIINANYTWKEVSTDVWIDFPWEDDS